MTGIRFSQETRWRTNWRGWLKPENRCLVPANSFAEYAPETNPATKKKDVVWFALNEDRPLFAFAGIWTEFQGRPGHQVQADPGTASGLRLPDDRAERCGRADPPEGHAGYRIGRKRCEQTHASSAAALRCGVLRSFIPERSELAAPFRLA